MALALGLAPAVMAKGGFMQFVSPGTDAADKDGDRNGIGQFNRQEANKSLYHVNGKIKTVSDTSVTVDVSSKDEAGVVTVTSYTFAIDTTTKIIRRFKGTAKVDELTVGHKVKVYATALTDGTAKLIWDKSIWWLRLAGKVVQLNDEDKTFQLQIPKRNDKGQLKTYLVKVKTNASTTYVNSDSTAATWDDLDNMDTVRIRGSWNSVGKYLLAKVITIVLP